MATQSRAALMSGPGKALSMVYVVVQSPGKEEVLIRNEAVALQQLDAKMLIAGYGPAAQLELPAVLGSSGAGVIEKIGEGVAGLQVGDRVVFDTKAYVRPDQNRRQGTWQQVVVCDASTVAKARLLP
jgi:NADPH:quinone reductase-like Zn-dependent oxidoreductase